MSSPDTLGHAVADFFTCFRHTKGPRAGDPFTFEPWQRSFVDEFYRVDRAGRRVYRHGILGIPRGNGKSPLAAGFGLFELVSRPDSPDVFCAAGSRDQARTVFNFARSFAESDGLRDALTPGKSAIHYEANRGAFRILSAKGSLQHGLSVSAAIADELHAFTTREQEELWTALFTALHKRVDAFALVCTTAGYDKQSLLGRMYDDALKLPSETREQGALTIARDEENGVLLWWYGLPKGTAVDDSEAFWAAMRRANPASWVDVDRDLRRQFHSPGMSELDVLRLHGNVWTKTRDAWLPAGVWSQLGTATPIPDGAEICVGVDVGLVHDSTAVAWAHRLEDGRVAVRARVWSARDETIADRYVADGRISLSTIESFITDELASRYAIRELVFDPRFFERSSEDLARAGLTVAPLHQSSATMADAYQAFYAAAREGKVSHTGDPVLAAHVEATGAELTERGWKVRKLREGHKIDACVAAVMAHSRAARHQPKRPNRLVSW